MDVIVATLMFWLTQHAPELPVPKAPPVAVKFVTHAEILRMTHGDAAAKTTGSCYRGVVYLDEKLDIIHSTSQRSVLLHELVHYAQNGCAIPRDLAERTQVENQAYEIQARYLTDSGYAVTGFEGGRAR